MSHDDISGDDLLAIVAHDLKSPISAVRGYIDLVQQSGELNEKQKHYCQRALNGLDRMANMVANMLEITRLEDNELTLHLEVCNLGLLARKAAQLVESSAEKRGITIMLDVDEDTAQVYGDVHLLDQVIMNLLTNAIKYNRDEGRIWMRVSAQAEMVRLDVQDTGHGIPQGDQARVFDRFYRAHSHITNQTSGSGLGLTIVRTIIEKHDGIIWLESVEDEGSTFSFTLPRHKQSRESANPIQESAWSSGEGQDVRALQPHEFSIEEHDVIDDNTQEARHFVDTDSSNDVV